MKVTKIEHPGIVLGVLLDALPYENWPCQECGREDEDAPLRMTHVFIEEERLDDPARNRDKVLKEYWGGCFHCTTITRIRWAREQLDLYYRMLATTSGEGSGKS